MTFSTHVASICLHFWHRVHHARMNDGMHRQERPTRRQAGGAFLHVDAWQSGLLHRAYPSADAWVSKPLLASREVVSQLMV
jgi:hypothetical protein